MIFTSNSTEETEALGKRLAKGLDGSKISHALIALRGEMGVGKTAFVRGFASYFDISGVKSPTYTVVNEYHGSSNIYHFDMYRIESEDDLYSIGFDEYIDKDGYAILEWSENVAEFLPDNVITVTISRLDGDVSLRKIEIIADGIYDNISI